MFRKRIGEYLLKDRLLTVAQIDRILAYSEGTGLRFGEAAIKLKFLTRQQLLRAYSSGFNAQYFNLHAKFFPKATLNAFSTEEIIARGSVGLGFKIKKSLFRSQKILNVGLLEAPDDQSLAEIKKSAISNLGSDAFESIQVYLIFADQLLDVLRVVYGVEEDFIKSLPKISVNRILRMFLAEE